jgi:hypothetical protein
MSRLTKAVGKMLGMKRRRHVSVTAEKPQRLPNFFICGAARCGTTSLWQYLRQHPDIYMPATIEQKEPAYFCDLYGYREWHHYLYLFHDAGDRKRVGEASTPYLTSPESAGRIKAAIPDAKVIISLRNPVVRAYSLYKWMHDHGYEKIASFPEALTAEEAWRLDNDEFKTNNGQYYHNFLYYHSGLFFQQVKRYFDIFGREQVHVLIFEEFVKTPLEHVRRLFEFLGVTPGFDPKLEVHNPSALRYPPLESSLRSELARRYRGNVLQLEALLNRELGSLWI